MNDSGDHKGRELERGRGREIERDVHQGRVKVSGVGCNHIEFRCYSQSHRRDQRDREVL